MWCEAWAKPPHDGKGCGWTQIELTERAQIMVRQLYFERKINHMHLLYCLLRHYELNFFTFCFKNKIIW